MYILEYNYQEDKPSNCQFRILEVPYFDIYKKLLLGELDSDPSVRAPDGFKIVKEGSRYLMGKWSNCKFPDITYIHIAKIFNMERDFWHVTMRGGDRCERS